MPDAHISLHSCSTVLPLGQHCVYEVLRMDRRSLEPLLVCTDFAEAEQVQIAFFEAFPQDASKVLLVSLFCSIACSMPILKQPTFRSTVLAVPPAG